MTTTSSASRLSSQEQAQLIYQILSDVYDKSPWTLEQVVADLTWTLLNISMFIIKKKLLVF